MNKKSIGIIYYGAGNLLSITNAVKHCQANVLIIDSKINFAPCDKYILPGVGAFKFAMTQLKNRKLLEVIHQEIVTNEKPLLGICLGMQLLFETGSEMGYTKGLSLIKGHVRKLSATAGKLPHIGWKKLKASEQWKLGHSLFKDVKSADSFYFVHSFSCIPFVRKDILAYSEHGNEIFCSVVKHKNIWGCQFHPEKSREPGIKILQNYIKSRV